MNTQIEFAIKAELEKAVDSCSKALRQFPKGPMGITSDAIKASPDYQRAKREYAAAFAALRKFNSKAK